MNLPSRLMSRVETASRADATSATPYSLADKVQGWLRMRTPREHRMRLIETLPLGPRRSVAMIECDGQRFLAGLGADGVTTLVPVNDSTSNSRATGVA